MEWYDLLLRIIDAVGSVATAIALIITLQQFRTKLKIRGEFSLNKTNTYVLSIKNGTRFDCEIDSICFYQGNPSKEKSTCFYHLDFKEYIEFINPNTNNIRVFSNKSIALPIDCKCVGCNYAKHSSVFKNPYSPVYIRITDTKGHSYKVYTEINAVFFLDLYENEDKP